MFSGFERFKKFVRREAFVRVTHGDLKASKIGLCVLPGVPIAIRFTSRYLGEPASPNRGANGADYVGPFAVPK